MPKHSHNSAEVIKFLMAAVSRVADLDSTKSKLVARTKKLKVAVDCGNGMGGFVLPFFQELWGQNVEWVVLYPELDGNFPNHPANPIDPKNLLDLQKAVLTNNCDFGAAFDGDADRVFFVDELGRPILTELLTAVFAKEMLQTGRQKVSTDQSLVVINPNHIVHCVSYSRALADIVFQNGGVVIPSKQGHTHIKAKMLEYRAIYGAEGSGHHYYGEFGFMDSGVITLGLFIKVLQSYSAASEITLALSQNYFVSGEQNFKVKPGQTMENIKQKLLANFPDAQTTQEDGITIFYPSWKLTLRGSNTEPVVRLNLETIGQNLIPQKMEQIKKLLEF